MDGRRDQPLPLQHLTPRQRRRLSDLLFDWSVSDDPALTGEDRDAIGRLRFLLDEDE